MSPFDISAATPAILRGDEDAFERLFNVLAHELIQFAMAIGRRDEANRAIAEDVVTDAFWSLWQRRQQLPGDTQLRAYLYRSVRNGMLNQLRAHRREEARYTSMHHAGDIPAMDSTQTLALHQLEHEELSATLWAAIREFPEPRRSVVILRWSHGLSFDEIAEVLQIPAGTVRSHATRAVVALREFFAEYDITD